MFHKRCIERGDHYWDDWYAKVCRSDGIAVETFPDGMFISEDSNKTYFYIRKCQNMGCDAKQYALKLIPDGQNEIVDTHESEKAIEELRIMQKGAK